MKDEKYEYGVKNGHDVEGASHENIFSKNEKKTGDVAAKFYCHIK